MFVLPWQVDLAYKACMSANAMHPDVTMHSECYPCCHANVKVLLHCAHSDCRSDGSYLC